jgi:hypothetical protein
MRLNLISNHFSDPIFLTLFCSFHVVCQRNDCQGNNGSNCLFFIPLTAIPLTKSS